jgi:hypothetical protein
MRGAAITVIFVIIASLVLASCSGSGRTRVSYGVGMGYGGYYGHGPWRGHPSYPIYVGGGGIPDIPQGPSASQLPDFGMPDVGMMDMGGFDDF